MVGGARAAGCAARRRRGCANGTGDVANGDPSLARSARSNGAIGPDVEPSPLAVQYGLYAHERRAAVVDVALAPARAAVPWALGFADDRNARNCFLGMAGISAVVVALTQRRGA